MSQTLINTIAICRYLRRGRAVVFSIEVPDFLPEQAVEESLSQRAGSSGSRDANAECRNVADDEARNEQVNKVQNKCINRRSEFLGVGIAGCNIAECSG